MRRVLRVMPLYVVAVAVASLAVAKRPLDVLHGAPYLVFLNAIPAALGAWSRTATPGGASRRRRSSTSCCRFSRSFADVFVERTHDVQYVVDELGAKTLDPVIAKYASVDVLTMVTRNVKHYRLFLSRRNKAAELVYPHMGLLGFQCPETSGEARLRAYILLIEHEHEYVQHLADKRLRVLIGFDQFKVFREGEFSARSAPRSVSS